MSILNTRAKTNKAFDSSQNEQAQKFYTSWDIFKLGKSAEEYAGMKIREIMSTRLATLDPGQHIGAVAEALIEHLFHAVPIVNDHRELLGIVTTTDVLRYEYGKEYPANLDKFVVDNM